MKVFLLGDSIANCQGVSIHDGWAVKVSKYITDLTQNKGFLALSAVNGSTSRQALERLPYEIRTLRCDFMLVQFGLNDCNFWESDLGLARVSPRSFLANLEEIGNRGLSAGAKRVGYLNNHPTRKVITNMGPLVNYEESNARYSEIVSKCVEMNNSFDLIDTRGAFEKEIERGNSLLDLLEDSVHLSSRGHKIYFQLVKEWIDKVEI